MAIIHVLGSDIPHHNTTLLTFFDRVLATELPSSQRRQFIVVSQDTAIVEQFPNLSIECFATKQHLAQRIMGIAKDRQTVFFCHGQFNAYLWLALLTGRVKKHQFHWHIWGADLYEASQALKFKMFYALRRRAQGRIAGVYATLGDLSVYHQRYPKVPSHKLYFPTKMSATELPKTATVQPLTILLGNSGDPTNKHCQALTQIAQQFGQQVKIIIPMGYPQNNQQYIASVQTQAAQLFEADQVEILTEKLDFEAYLKVVAQCNLGYFIFARQQGIGTLSVLIDNNIPFVISRKNPFWRDLAEQQLPVLFDEDSLDHDVIQHARQQLIDHDKTGIEFFSPAYLRGWREVLQNLEGREAK
ncbi:TDP-N-acetylfucosamine:lipid II N-acetylfucosaminyltransferase [Rosenbergiella collisarenosi]|uniref:TDP-N-acetylfucosamine:lipid II N-acetylfucosaminyltransferase n=1 Tax=Rosenbergiella collisarenosi TaxID=1544695 RepID=UPI001BDB360B|nr:TDP-N-acetylfucosamine:lipid II N-acetylfucosaminyltransferase [Rosenbergiella collisarenosi]